MVTRRRRATWARFFLCGVCVGYLSAVGAIPTCGPEDIAKLSNVVKEKLARSSGRNKDGQIYNPMPDEKLILGNERFPDRIAEIVSGTKPSAAGLPANKSHGYHNPGYHDKRVSHNPSKSSLPENHVELWNKSMMSVSGDPLKPTIKYFAAEREKGKIVFHEFHQTGSNGGVFHWSEIQDKVDRIPNEIRKALTSAL